MKVKDLIKNLEGYDPDDSVVGVIWSGSDVAGQANDMGYELTPEQIEEVCQALYRRHDAEHGISWSTIEYWINELQIRNNWAYKSYDNTKEE